VKEEHRREAKGGWENEFEDKEERGGNVKRERVPYKKGRGIFQVTHSQILEKTREEGTERKTSQPKRGGGSDANAEKGKTKTLLDYLEPRGKNYIIRGNLKKKKRAEKSQRRGKKRSAHGKAGNNFQKTYGSRGKRGEREQSGGKKGSSKIWERKEETSSGREGGRT